MYEIKQKINQKRDQKELNLATLTMAGGESGRSFEYTPTWVVAVVCFIIVYISVLAERGLHKLGKCFKRKNQEALFEALQKVKEELMLLGFISLLLTVFQGTISHFCIPEHVANIMLPCKLKSTTAEHLTAKNVRRLLAEGGSQQCSEMGSMFKQTVFDEFTQELLRTWAKDSKPSSTGRSRRSSSRLTTEPTDAISHSQESVVDGQIAASEVELSTSHMPSSWNN
ncbi:UNVERIFIED_CONTAM: MLO-like protein 13 [Sesamum latifolium]|uniref:MLO-like protein 13 n=1 Tax=Sesamum latifolium TaxID=2727402 RepID=A0AAW2UZ17_9LAMI